MPLHQMQGVQNLRRTYMVRRNDEGEAQSALGGQMDFLRSHQSWGQASGNRPKSKKVLTFLDFGLKYVYA